MSAPSPYSSPPPEPQAVLTPITESAIFLVLTIDPGGEETVYDLLQDVSALRRSVGFRVPDAGLTCVAGIGSDAWGRLFTGPRPAGLHPSRSCAGRATPPRPLRATCCSTSAPAGPTSASSWPPG